MSSRRRSGLDAAADASADDGAGAAEVAPSSSPDHETSASPVRAHDRNDAGAWFWGGVVVGGTVMVGATIGLTRDVWLRDRPGDVGLWVLGTALVHDLVLAPTVTLVGLALARVLPEPARGPVRGAAALTGILVLFAYPLLRGFGRRAANPSILPLDYGRGLAVLVGVVWAVAVVLLGWRRWARGRRGPS
ncbi:MAG: hypothetical protein R2726_06990 [Acidimicrobiales bacterium]